METRYILFNKFFKQYPIDIFENFNENRMHYNCNKIVWSYNENAQRQNISLHKALWKTEMMLEIQFLDFWILEAEAVEDIDVDIYRVFFMQPTPLRNLPSANYCVNPRPLAERLWIKRTQHSRDSKPWTFFCSLWVARW